MVKEERHESDEDKKIKKESDLKKFLKKRSFLYLMCAVAFVVIVVPDMIAPSDLDKKLVENLVSDEQNTAWNIVKSYKGADDDGFIADPVYSDTFVNTYGGDKDGNGIDDYVELYTAVNIDNNESYRSVVGQRLISSPRQLFLGFSIGF